MIRPTESIPATRCPTPLTHHTQARDAATGATPILLSAERGDDGIARILLDRGASVHAVDNHQQNALHLAAMNGHSKYLELMLAHGGDMEVRCALSVWVWIVWWGLGGSIFMGLID